MFFGLTLAFILIIGIFFPSVLIALPYFSYFFGFLIALGAPSLIYNSVPTDDSPKKKSREFLVNSIGGALAVVMLFKISEPFAAGILIVWSVFMLFMALEAGNKARKDNQ